MKLGYVGFKGKLRNNYSLVATLASDIYGPMNVHCGTVISAIVTVNLFRCILHFKALYGRATL